MRLKWVEQEFASVSQSKNLHFLGGKAWDYMRSLMKEIADDFDTFDQRLKMVQAIHEDRGLKRPMLPWGDDWYRRCEYEVDYDAGRFWVTLPDGSREEGTAKL
eukprot:symbB.v1.2.017896.t1/scaffold1392.1/size121922/3